MNDKYFSKEGTRDIGDDKPTSVLETKNQTNAKGKQILKNQNIILNI